jgi:hypothetical protein
VKNLPEKLPTTKMWMLVILTPVMFFFAIDFLDLSGHSVARLFAEIFVTGVCIVTLYEAMRQPAHTGAILFVPLMVGVLAKHIVCCLIELAAKPFRKL